MLIGAFAISAISRHSSPLDSAIADVQGSRELVKRAVAHETQVDLQAKLVEDSAHAALARAAAATEAAGRAQNRANASRAHFEQLAAAAPVECDSSVSAAQIALAFADSEAEGLRTANSQLREGASGLQRALDSTRTAADSVRAAAVNLSGKAGILVKVSKQSLISRLLPRPGVGLAAGVNASGQPQLIVGATLGWSF